MQHVQRAMCFLDAQGADSSALAAAGRAMGTDGSTLLCTYYMRTVNPSLCQHPTRPRTSLGYVPDQVLSMRELRTPELQYCEGQYLYFLHSGSNY